MVRYHAMGALANDATVLAICGAGPSGYKRLDLSVGGRALNDVAHRGDAAPGDTCWSLATDAQVEDAEPIASPDVGAALDTEEWTEFV